MTKGFCYRSKRMPPNGGGNQNNRARYICSAKATTAKAQCRAQHELGAEGSAAFEPQPGPSPDHVLSTAGVDGRRRLAGATTSVDSFATAGNASTFETASATVTWLCLGRRRRSRHRRRRRRNPFRTGFRTGLRNCGRPPAAGGAVNCPRHFFSSHSTQSTRPADTGNPHASHFFNPAAPEARDFDQPRHAWRSVSESIRRPEQGLLRRRDFHDGWGNNFRFGY